MSRPILNIAEVDLPPRPAGFAATGAAADRYDARMGPIASRLGALGYNLTAVPPGKRAFPFHNHRVNDEMFVILEGAGEVRIGEAVHPIRAGDIIACPPGGPETAHQIVMGQVEAGRAIEPLCMLWCIPGFLHNQWTHAFKLIR